MPAILAQLELGHCVREVPEWLGAAPTKPHAEHVSQEGPLVTCVPTEGGYRG